MHRSRLIPWPRAYHSRSSPVFSSARAAFSPAQSLPIALPIASRCTAGPWWKPTVGDIALIRYQFHGWISLDLVVLLGQPAPRLKLNRSLGFRGKVGAESGSLRGRWGIRWGMAVTRCQLRRGARPQAAQEARTVRSHGLKLSLSEVGPSIQGPPIAFRSQSARAGGSHPLVLGRL